MKSIRDSPTALVFNLIGQGKTDNEIVEIFGNKFNIGNYDTFITQIQMQRKIVSENPELKSGELDILFMPLCIRCGSGTIPTEELLYIICPKCGQKYGFRAKETKQ